MSALDTKIIDWIIAGDTGISSEAIACHLTGRKPTRWGLDYPHDIADFGRCARLLQSIPELRPLFPKMAEVSAVWAALVLHWDEILHSMEKEVGISWEKGRSAPDTYALMCSVIDGAKTA